jgi:Rap1a immunity proteins
MIKPILLSGIVFTALSIWIGSASAGIMNGTKLLARCTTPKSAKDYDIDYAYCVGYLAAMIDSGSCKSPDPHMHYQPFVGSNAEQIRLLSVQWMKANPDKLEFDANGLIQMVMLSSFPCP